MRFTKLFGFVTIVCIFTAGCANTNNTPPFKFIPTQTSIPVTETPIPPTQTRTPTFTPTTVPTLSVDDAHERLLDLLANNGDCHLPCLWSITPGKSTYQEAQTILTPLSSISNSTHLNLFSPNDISPIYIEDSSTLNTFVAYTYADDGIINSIAFQAKEEKNTVTSNGESSIAEIYDSRTFSERTYPYMLPQVLSDQGIPAAVLIQTYNALSNHGQRIGGGFEILLLYPDQGLLVHYTTQMQLIGTIVRGCPAHAQVELELYPSGEGDSFSKFLAPTEWAFAWPLPLDNPFWKPIEKATSLSLEQFYETFRQSTNRCIETPASLWPAPFQ